VATSTDGKRDHQLKYTRGKSVGGSWRYKGWTNEGKERVNELLEFVRKNWSRKVMWD
jgi:hypothetical protein